MWSSLSDNSLVERKRIIKTVEQYPVPPREGDNSSMAGAIFTRSEIFEYDLIPSDPNARSGSFLPPHVLNKQKEEEKEEQEAKVLPIEHEQTHSPKDSKLSGNTFRERPSAMPRVEMSPEPQDGFDAATSNGTSNTMVMQRWQREIEDVWDSSLSIETLMRKHPSNWQDIRRLMRIEKLDVDTLKRYGIRAVNTLDGIILPRYQHSRQDRNPLKPSALKIVRLIHGVRQTLETEILPDDGSFNGFFGWHMVNPEDREMTVVSDELDAMALWQASNRRTTIAIPPDCWEDGIDLQVIPYLEDFDRVHMWFPEDHIEKARRFGLDLPGIRTALVLSDDDRDPVKSGPMRMLRQGRNNEIRLALKESSKEFLPAIIRSKEMLTPEQLRGHVREELFNHGKVSKGFAQWLRFKSLNSYLLGFRGGEMTILSGRTGIGKTTFLSEYTVDLMSQGVRTLFCTLEVPVNRVYKCMLQQLARSPLHKSADRLNAERTMDKFERMGLVFFFDREVFDNMMGPDYPAKAIDALRSHIRMNAINHVVIDNLQFLVGQALISKSDISSSASLDSDIMQDFFVQKFRQLSTETKAHITMVVHPKKECDEKLSLDSLYGGPRVTQEADNVLLINKTDNKKYLNIAKNRFGGERVEDDRLELKFHKESLCHIMSDRLTTTTTSK